MDIISANSLVRVVSTLKKRGAVWQSPCGTPVFVLKKWLGDRGWTVVRPWSWRHEVGRATLTFNDSFDVDQARHELRACWKLWAFDQFLWSSRREVETVAQTTVQHLLNIPWNDIRRLCDSNPAARCVALGARCSPGYFWTQENFDTSCLWCDAFESWHHLAWVCPCSPFLSRRPALPRAGVERRFGWGNPGTLEYLSLVQQAIWDKRHSDV